MIIKKRRPEAHGGVSKIRALYVTAYFAGSRKAGMPEELRRPVSRVALGSLQQDFAARTRREPITLARSPQTARKTPKPSLRT